MRKTVVVLVNRLTRHPKYFRYYKVSKKLKAHDENNEYQVGDTVMIEETKPLSKDKCWKVVSLIKRGTQESEQSEDDPSKEL